MQNAPLNQGVKGLSGVIKNSEFFKECYLLTR